MEEILFDGEKIDSFFKGDFSEKDKLYIDKIFCDENIEDELKHHLLRQFYELLPEDGLENKNLDHILYKIHYDINTRLPVHEKSRLDSVTNWVLRVACMIILPLLVYIGVHTYKENTIRKEAWVEITAPAWSRVQFFLPDGTTGWLNSKSSIKYNGNFINDRTVNLKGEAFFDVFKDKKRPFLVCTDEVNLKVLGTRFNIASYEDEQNVEVVLDEGKLVFIGNGMNKSYTMSPNDLITYDRTKKDFSTQVIDPQKYLSWIEGKLVFRNDPLDVIARRLARWYNIDVEIEGCSKADLRLRATFVDEDLDEVLDLLKRSLSINYRIENGDVKADGIYVKKKLIITLMN
jgi:transmembrane sensor